MHSPDLSPDSHDVNNMKFDLNVSTKVKFVATDHGILKTLHFLKGTHPHEQINEFLYT